MENKMVAIPSPPKHYCSTSPVTNSPRLPKSNPKFMNMDYSLPRDYKVFDVNLSISPLYNMMEDENSNKYKAKSHQVSTKVFVNYAKSKGPNHSPTPIVNDQSYIGDDDIRRAEMYTKSRTNHSPIMKLNMAEEMEFQKKLEKQNKKKHRRFKSVNAEKSSKKNVYDNPKFYKQSFNVVFDKYLNDLRERDGIPKV